MLLAALPLRGYAGVLTALCESHHAGAAAAQDLVHEHGGGHHDDSADGGGKTENAASVCSICASCCAGAALAAQSIQGVVIQPPGTHRILFLPRQDSGFVPEHLDRPPLSS